MLSCESSSRDANYIIHLLNIGEMGGRDHQNKQLFKVVNQKRLHTTDLPNNIPPIMVKVIHVKCT